MEKNKTEIIAQIVALLSQLVESGDEKKNESAAVSAAAPVEMLTIKECAEAVTGLSEHTIRQLVAQEKIPYIRTGKGKRGKMLISKAFGISGNHIMNKNMSIICRHISDYILDFTVVKCYNINIQEYVIKSKFI